MKIRNENTQFFICLLKEEDKLIAFENHEKGVYPIQMVFDKNIRSIDSKMSEISTYRSGFMSGELII